jgi:MFS family permease
LYTSVRGIKQDALQEPTNQETTTVVRSGRAVSSTVVLLGLTSLFTDVSSEMVAAILPIYTTLVLGLSPLAFGFVDGLYQGSTALFRLGAGYASDRSQRPKLVATTGYALSAVCKLALPAVGGLFSLTAVVAADRGGKGIRTAPRDAMIAAATPRASLGQAFGVHRAMDTAGAMAGPLLAFGILSALPGAYNTVFVTSFCFAVVGVAIIALLVRDRDPDVIPVSAPKAVAAVPAVRMRDAFGLLRERAVLFTCVVAGLLALLTVSDGFLYLSLQQRQDIPVHLFPLLFLATSSGYLLLAVPFGRLADRLGQWRVFIAGHVLLLGCYLVVLGPGLGVGVIFLALFLLGAYYAATDGVLSALTSRVLPEALRSSGLALVQTVVAIGKMVSALAFGAIWSFASLSNALAIFATALAVGIALALPLLRSAVSAANR